MQYDYQHVIDLIRSNSWPANEEGSSYGTLPGRAVSNVTIPSKHFAVICSKPLGKPQVDKQE
jgi:hypothetical protein